ncbi:ATP-dependent helicase HrpB [Denitratimonas sp. CY0512]|uniref:ATP-dependent helicase HrpB n=1 Tax=Denitratimonas sp. CY0512 TaxID=3131940 RepID=UPI00309BF89A
MSTAFPIDPLLPAIRESLAAHPRLVLEAPPGAGKTTRVPLALLDAPWLAGQRIVMLEPRRVAARAAAGFMARSLGEDVAQTVGYRIRFENRTSASTRIEVVTEGILTRMIQDDPMLDGIGAILFDEFHERHLAGDLGLALALDVQAQLREDLRIVVMSATLDGEKLARFLDAPRLTSEGRSFPVTISHPPARRDEPLAAQVRRTVEAAFAAHPGDILVFLPGQREIGDASRALESAGLNAEVLALHGELSIEAQSAVLQPSHDGRRRIVLATNVAESSVTLPGVRVVIDSGLAREPRFDPNSGFPRLDVVTIPQSSADQRAGRAGRVAEGWCYRLWPQSQRLEPSRRAEITLTELTGLALELATWGSDELRFFDSPPQGALAAGRDLLTRLGALENGRLTPFGKRLLRLGTHPRLAAMLLAADTLERSALACDLAALLEARDPLKGPRRDDIAARWQALAAFRNGRTPPDASRSALAAIDQTARQWQRRLSTLNPDSPNINAGRIKRPGRGSDIRASDPPLRGLVRPAPTRENGHHDDTASAHHLGELLIHAFPDRIAHQHPSDPHRYQLANGRSATLAPDSALYGEAWIVIAELRDAERDARIQRAAPVDETALEHAFPQRFVTEDRVFWDTNAHRIAAQRERRFDRITLDVRPIAQPDPAQFADALVDAVRHLGLDVLPWTDALKQWRERVRCLRDWLPENETESLPDLSDETLIENLDDWLKPALRGKRRLDALSETELADALKSNTDWPARQKIDSLAPTRILVPSGLERPIHYRHGEAPVLAVKLQELFGLADTPSIAAGRVPLTLHLLSPGGRPLQVTQDLKGFWERTYPEVKKEMKGRYPKHPWPDDPWTATATHRAKPRT